MEIKERTCHQKGIQEGWQTSQASKYYSFEALRPICLVHSRLILTRQSRNLNFIQPTQEQNEPFRFEQECLANQLYGRLYSTAVRGVLCSL